MKLAQLRKSRNDVSNFAINVEDLTSDNIKNSIVKNDRNARPKQLAKCSLPAWQPIITPTCILLFFLGSGAVCLIIGILLVEQANRTVQCKVNYADPPFVNDVPIEEIIWISVNSSDCEGLEPNKALESPNFYLYYGLSNFYQNQRSYVVSLNPEQLRGTVFTESAQLQTCTPYIQENNKILHPCGTIARTVFNDTFTLWTHGPDTTNSKGNEIMMDESANVIAWDVDVDYKYKNPDFSSLSPAIYEKVNFWLETPENKKIFPGGVENAHFIVWMRLAPVANFRKLYGKINQKIIDFPFWIRIENRYPGKATDSTKFIVFTNSNWIGGRNLFLGAYFLGLASLLIIVGITVLCLNTRRPRIIGDVSYLCKTN